MKQKMLSSTTGYDNDGDSNGENDVSLSLPVRRAWQLFEGLRNDSIPYVFSRDPDLSEYWHNADDAPDHAVYTLMFQICSYMADWETAERVYRMAQEQKRADDHGLRFASNTYAAFLKCLAHCPDQGTRFALAEQVYKEATKDDCMGISLQSALEKFHPELYARFQTDIGDNNRDDEESDDDDGDEEDYEL
jgi:hypothetical protein